MFYRMDATYILVIVGAILTMLASNHVQSTYKRYSSIRSASGITGAQAAEMILRNNGIYDVSVQHVSGTLTDHYDPSKKIVNLSDAVYGSSSVAAIGVAAHECGHVVQHHVGYAPLKIRTALVPLASFGSNIGIWIVMFGLILGLSSTLVNVGIVLFSFGVLFQLVTLPVEFDASNRALIMLEQYGILGTQEKSQSQEVLTAAALTYVASAAASVLTLLRLVLLSNNRRRRS